MSALKRALWVDSKRCISSCTTMSGQMPADPGEQCLASGPLQDRGKGLDHQGKAAATSVVDHCGRIQRHATDRC